MSDTHVRPFPLVRSFQVSRIGSEGTAVTVEADTAEMHALAAMNGLVGVDRLRGEFELVREGRVGVHVTGSVTATVVQSCVVTLEPFEAEIQEPVDLHFLPVADAAAALRTENGDGEGESDPPEPIVDGRIDLGAVTAEFVALGLDPYPRKPGASFAEPAAPANEPDARFAPLSRLKSGPSH